MKWRLLLWWKYVLVHVPIHYIQVWVRWGFLTGIAGMYVSMCKISNSDTGYNPEPLKGTKAWEQDSCRCHVWSLLWCLPVSCWHWSSGNQTPSVIAFRFNIQTSLNRSTPFLPSPSLSLLPAPQPSLPHRPQTYSWAAHRQQRHSKLNCSSLTIIYQ